MSSIEFLKKSVSRLINLQTSQRANFKTFTTIWFYGTRNYQKGRNLVDLCALARIMRPSVGYRCRLDPTCAVASATDTQALIRVSLSSRELATCGFATDNGTHE